MSTATPSPGRAYDGHAFVGNGEGCADCGVRPAFHGGGEPAKKDETFTPQVHDIDAPCYGSFGDTFLTDPEERGDITCEACLLRLKTENDESKEGRK